jgi:carboxymethylenebutenolidase
MTTEKIVESTEDWLTVATPDGPMRVYRVRPRPADAVTPIAAVVVFQEAFGVNGHIQDVARRVADEGYLALAPDLFHRAGMDTVDYTDRDTAMALINDIAPAQIHADAVAVLNHLRDAEDVPAQRTAIVGFCFGGRAAFTAATALPGLGGTVVFYGPGIAAGPHAVLDRMSGITGPVMMIVGDADPTIPPEHIAAIRTAADSAGIDLRVTVFCGAGHAFHCDARPALYVADIAKQAWAQTIDFLADTLAKGQP